MNEQELVALLSKMSPSERAMVIAQLQKSQGAQNTQQPKQSNGMGLGSFLMGKNGLRSMFGGDNGGTSAASNATPGASNVFPVGTAENGGTLMSDGSVAPAGTNFMTAPLESLGGYSPAQGIGAAQAAYGTYQTAKGLDNGGEGVRSGLTNAGAGIGSMVMPGVGTVAGAAIGNTLGYGLQGSGWKNKLALAATSPTLLAATMLGFNPIRKTVAQRQQNRSQELSNLDKGNQDWQNYLSVMRNQPKPEEGKAFGNYATWDEYKRAGLDATNLSGVYGNLKTFGSQWSGLTQEQRNAITQAGIDNNLYESKKGDVMVTDPEKLKNLAAGIIGGGGSAVNDPGFARGQGMAAVNDPGFGGVGPVSTKTALNLISTKPTIDAGTLRRWRLSK